MTLKNDDGMEYKGLKKNELGAVVGKSEGITKIGTLGKFTVYKDLSAKEGDVMKLKGTTSMEPITEDNMCVPYIPPIELSGETKNKLWELAQGLANSSREAQYIWIWNIVDASNCHYDIVSVSDTENLYSQDPNNHLLATVYPIPNPIQQPIKGNVK